MVTRPSLSKAEMEVIRLVWKFGETTVRQVLEALPPARQLDYKTVQTYLRRLESKGYVSARRKGKRIFYRASVRPTQVVRETIRDFVSRLFDGDALPLVEHLIQDPSMTPEDIARLRDMLDDVDKSENTNNIQPKGRRR